MSHPRSIDLDKLLKRIDHLIKTRPGYSELLEFYREVIIQQQGSRPEIRVGSIPLDKDLVEAKVKEGVPLLDRKDFKLDLPSAKSLFRRICEILERHKPEISASVQKIKKAFDEDRLDLEALFRKGALDDEEYILALANELDLNKDLLIFLAKESTRPSVEVYAQKYNGIVDEKLWLRGYCPICGSKPKMAELQGEEGRRTLLCSFCGNVWFYKRLKCPYCESEDPEALKYFYIEGEETACRIDICERCRGYIKTVDSRKISGEVVPFIEDLGSLHLDIIAIKEGYTKVSGNMLGIKFG